MSILLEQVIKTSAELCADWQTEDVELEYDEDDFSNLTTFKLFCDSIKPLVVADTFLQAKYREFVMQVPPMERSNYDTVRVGMFQCLVECTCILFVCCILVRLLAGVAHCSKWIRDFSKTPFRN